MDLILRPAVPADVETLHRFVVELAATEQFPGEVLVVPSGNLKVRANDTDYRFRPSSDFTWLVGSHVPDSVLVVDPEGNATLFGADAVAKAIVAEVGGSPAGFALYYPTYSTIVGRSGIHLEDLYVAAEFRGAGIGQVLLARLAESALARGGRLEWWVLRTNEPALRFYRRLAARGLDEIEVMRLDGEALGTLAAMTH